MHLLYGQMWGTCRKTNVDFVLLVKTFENKDLCWVELYMMQIFDHVNIYKHLGNLPNFLTARQYPLKILVILI